CRKCGTQFSPGERLQLRSEQSQPQPQPAPVINVYNQMPEWHEPARQEPIVVQPPPSPAITINNIGPTPLVQQTEAPFTVVDGPDMSRVAEVMRPRRRRVIRDEDGRIIELEEVPGGA